ncbi:MAG TPA: YkuJ family protein [Weissella thailandensis]|uniref:DUF1797 family protein n=1 Tax=Weissella thailandensis TaxID=89061 RepID=UPI001D7305F6|nr:DUF1797 family protein [Weissella thailandensis]HJG84353.1 YkuJ family protein [Weissella thailandensis]
MLAENDLNKIVRRIQAMRRDDQTTVQQRDFSVFGVPVVTVVYDSVSGIFALETTERKQRRFAFDDVDLLAIDIYEALVEFKESF